MKTALSNFQRCIIFMLLLAAMNVGLSGTYLVLAAFLIFAVMNRKLCINKTACLLIAFSATYIIIALLNAMTRPTSIFSIFRVVVYPCCYLIAYSVFSGIAPGKRTEIIEKLVVAIAVFMALHSVTNFVANYVNGGFAVFASGRTIDFWSGSQSTATGQASYYFFMAAVLPYALFYLKKSIKKYLLLALYGVCLFHNILLGGRTFIGLSIIAVVCGITISAFVDSNKRKFVWSLILVGITICLVALAYSQNYFGLKTAVNESYFYRRFFAGTAYTQDIMSSARWQDKVEYLRHFFEYPFGGNHLLNEVVLNYSHELWLDTFDAVGWIPFFILWAYTFGAIKRTIYCLRTAYSPSTKILVGSVSISLLASFFMEPILIGCPMVFVMFCFYDGMLSSITKGKRDERIVS